jgi:hypothetical protein
LNGDTPRPAPSAPKRAIAALVCAGALLGLAPRLYFASSHGSWDTEYWKAWAFTAANSGVLRSYGGPDAVPDGQFFEQLTGRAPRWEVQFRGRSYPTDYPPLGLLAWGESWRFFTGKPRPYRGDAAENVAVKFPALLGDALGAGLLLFLFRREPARAAAIALAYWLFPVTWVSSAALGFFDGFVAPFLLAALFVAPAAPFVGGLCFAFVVLVKPTAAVAVFALFLSVPKAAWFRVVAGGAAGTALVFAPFAFAGTLETAIVHVVRIFSQDRISGGYANLWWLAGHAWNVVEGRTGAASMIDYVRRDAFPWPAGALGFVAFGAAAAFALGRLRGVASARQACLLAATLLFAWGFVTVGAHDNHNHPLFLLLAGTGLGSPFLRRFTLALATTTLLGSVALHGIGRFYGGDWRGVSRVAEAAEALRMSAGFDLTLALALVNAALAVWLLRRLRGELERL